MTEQIIEQPSSVEFRTPSANGVRVVKVMLATTMPRIMAYVEEPDRTVHPMSLFWDEAQDYIQRALEIKQKGGR